MDINTACASHVRLPAEQLDVHGARTASPLAPCTCVPVSGIAAGRGTAGQDRVALVGPSVGGEVVTLAALAARLVTVTRLARAAPPPPRTRVARLAAIRAAGRPLGAAGGRWCLECGGGGCVEELVISDDLARGAISMEDDGAHLAPPLHLPLPVLQRRERRNDEQGTTATTAAAAATTAAITTATAATAAALGVPVQVVEHRHTLCCLA